MTARDVEILLKTHGFVLVSQVGSHRKWRHLKSRLQVIVPEHRGRTLPIGTLLNILTNASIPEKEWRD
ncbi:MAG: type II toxin-antitoxin system HicA family toxin [Candidatus Hydrogenedentes bacterium]|nr:type II toxin-antitoxin system HicA family toxin [Candidatus Hydrogenedentota bacterium]